MKKNIIILIGGIVTGVILCLTAASVIPLEEDSIQF